MLLEPRANPLAISTIRSSSENNGLLARTWNESLVAGHLARMPKALLQPLIDLQNVVPG